MNYLKISFDKNLSILHISFFFVHHKLLSLIMHLICQWQPTHHCRLSSADKNAIQVAGHYSAHIGLAPSFKLTGLQISLQSGSIIITDMLHRPVLLPHILSDFSRSIPLLQCNVLTLLHTFTLKRAGTSLRTYLVARHILTSCMQKYSVVKVQRCIISNQWIGKGFSDRMLCNFKSQYFCNQLGFQSAT